MQRRGSFLKLNDNTQPAKYIKFFDEISLKDTSLVGGKNSSLGEMYQHLRANNVRVPYGFAVTIQAYEAFIDHNNLASQIAEIMSNLKDDLGSLSEVGSQVRQLIRSGEYPTDLSEEITQAYKLLCEYYKVPHVDVAVRSSSLSEDSVTSSYAGQQDTYLNISELDNVLMHIKMCYASLYTDRAISYCRSQNDSIGSRKMSVGVQKMVRSDLGASGVAMTIDTESGFRNAIIINGSYGLGELVVGGEVDPDEFCIFKPTGAIIDKKLGSKLKKLIYEEQGSQNKTKEVETTSQERSLFCLDERHIRKLGRWAIDIENHYAKIAGVESRPMDIEWAFDGQSDELYIVQARPVTTLKAYGQLHEYHLKEGQTLTSLVTGTAVGDRIATGTVRIITSVNDPEQVKSFQKGDILVADATSPDFEPIMALASAIVTNRGGRTCHAAIIAREQGIPAIVGCGNATEKLGTQTEMKITVCCSQGEVGCVYAGQLEYDLISLDLTTIQKPVEPKVQFNLASPDIAFKTSMLPHAGVGLLRMEFIINNFIKIHPLALINYDQQPDEIKTQISELIKGYESPIEYYIQKLAYGIAKITAAFSPYEVILRFSDFKSNEYRNLLGGTQYEPTEENPMIGWRGASRYYSKKFEPAFLLECLAVKRVREDMGLDNLVVMIPFCRTPEELVKVTEAMAKANLVRGVNGLKLYVMAEIPVNFLMAEEFSQLVDGFSIGSNDLTQTTLGLDRDSHLVAHLYDEENPAVKALIRQLLIVAKKNQVKVGICGQGPSDRPKFVEFLMECGIDSISITPDSLFKVFNNINQLQNVNNNTH